MKLSRFFAGLAYTLALVGGLALLVVIGVTIVSVSGRALIAFGLRPIPGDYELVEALTGFAVFCFLPLCQLNRGHVMVDILTKPMGPQLVLVIDMISEIIMTIVLVVIAWRLTLGTLDKLRYGETSFILQFPTWWAFAACLLPAYGAALTGFYTSWRSIRSCAAGRDLAPQQQVIE